MIYGGEMVRFLMMLFCAGALFAQERLYVVQATDESLGEVNLVTGAVNTHVLQLGYLCNDIVVHGTRLYVTISGLNTVQEIDAMTNTTLREIPVIGGVNPYSAAFINADTLAVTNWISNNVVLLRLSDGTSVGNIAVGLRPEGILTVGDRFYVCLTRYQSGGGYGPGVVVVYDRHSLQLVDSIRVGTNPQYAAVDDRNRLHVVCTGDYANVGGQIVVVNLNTMHTDTVLAVGGTPLNVSFGGRNAFVTAGGWGDSGFVFRYRLDDLAILNDAAHPIRVGPGATDIEVRPDTSFYVSCFSLNQIEHRSADGHLITAYPISTGPGQMVLYGSPDEAAPHLRHIPRQRELAEAYPNPFNTAVRLRLSAAVPVSSSILIYNALGELVKEVEVAAGSSEVLWSPQSSSRSYITSGIYYAVWEQADWKTVHKLVYLR